MAGSETNLDLVTRDGENPDPLEELLSDVDGGSTGAMGMGADGLPMPIVGNIWDDPLPSGAVEDFICRQGPCRHLFELKGPQPTLTKGFAAPTRIVRYCMRMVGSYIPLAEESITKCNQWSPTMDEELAVKKAARLAWLDAHPECKKGLANGT